MTASSHPILQSLTLSEVQARAAFGPTDVLVTAGAGTGKTWALTARFLALLAAGLPLRGIVAITFTRKAAREMRKRIREQVWAYLARPDLEPAERARWNAIASQLDAARISTIHSLCQEILRFHPVEARVDPDFQVIEEGRMALLKREAVEDVLFWAANQADLAGLFAQVGESEVRGALSALLQQGVDARALLAAMPHRPDALLAAWETELARMQRARLEEIMADPDWQAARAAIEQARIRVPSDKLSMLVQAAREALHLLADRQDADALRRAAALLGGIKKYNVGTAKAWPEGKTAIQQALKTLREPFFGKENAWLSMGLNEEDARSARALAALRAVALQAFAIYGARKGEAHALDFDDLETRAVSLLEDHSSVRRRWQEEVQALLVDEFQDTNARQARLLELLDGGRGVRFLVGDAKQSIYRFRGAEVAVFTRTEGDFEAAGKRVARLNATYRAHAHLVDGLNDLLEPVLGRARHDWEAAFAPLTPARDRAPRIASDAFIEVQLAAGNKGEAMPIAARAAVNRLMALFDQGYAPGDAAILCRATTSFAAYEDALDAAGVPFLTLAGRGFFQRPEIRDLTNVMRAAADPTDDVALVGALRSPGLGLSDVALYHLARHRERLRQTSNVKRHDLWTAVQTPPDDFPPDELPRLTFAREVLATLHGMAGRAPVADLLKGYVDETDYLAILAGAGQSRAVRNVNKLLADVQAAGLVHMASFLEWIDLARDEDVREGEAPVVAEGAVQIMTVHRAKGLEFPIVVLGDITYGPRRGRGGMVIADGWMAWKVPSPSENETKPAFYQLLQRMEARKEDAEDKRLFYVAATRAEDHLILNGVVGRWNKGGWYRWLKLALPELDAFVQAEGAGEQICRLGMAGAPVRCVRVDDAAAPLRTYAPETDALAPPPFQPKLLAPFEPVEDALDEDARQREQEPERRVWRIFPPEGARAWAPAWMVGKLVHRSIELERMPDAPNFDAWLEASARGLGLSDPGMIRNALWRARRLLRNLAESTLWAEIQTADQRLHEVPYAYLDPDGVPARGTIDLLYRTGERWTLVDFKTDRARDQAEMEAIIAEKGYDEQVRRYAEAVRAILDVTPRAVVCFLDVGGEVAVYRVNR